MADASVPTQRRESLWRLLRPSGACLLALAIVLAAEGAVRTLVPNLGWYEGIGSLTQWVNRLGYELKTVRPARWLCGNSVLAYGVDTDRLAAATGGTPSIALPFGGATFAGDVAMLSYFLRRAPQPPREVVFILTKDDLNAAGERAYTSRKYLEYDTWRGITLDRVLRLACSRSTIANTVKSKLLGRDTAAARNPSEAAFDGVVTPEKAEYMCNLAKDYTFDDGTFNDLCLLANRYGFSVVIVMAPVSRAYLDFHATACPDAPSVADLHARIADNAAGMGFRFLDLSESAPDDYSNYADPYHLTALGRDRFTDALARELY